MPEIVSLVKYRKYLPFIEFIFKRIDDKDKIAKEKLKRIKDWIENNANLRKENADKVYGVIVQYYRNLHIQKTTTPPWIDAIFNPEKHETINLCVDDESDDSDVEVVENNEATDTGPEKTCDKVTTKAEHQIAVNKNSNDTDLQLQTGTTNIIKKSHEVARTQINNSNDTVVPMQTECETSAKYNDPVLNLQEVAGIESNDINNVIVQIHAGARLQCNKNEFNDTVEQFRQVGETQNNNSNSADLHMKSDHQSTSKGQNDVEIHKNVLLHIFENILDSNISEKLTDSIKGQINFDSESKNNVCTKTLPTVFDDIASQIVPNGMNVNGMYQNQERYSIGVNSLTNISCVAGSTRTSNCYNVNVNDPRIKSSAHSQIYGPQHLEVQPKRSFPNTAIKVYKKVQSANGEVRSNPIATTYGEYKKQQLLKESMINSSNNTLINEKLNDQPKNQNQIDTLVNTSSAQATSHLQPESDTNTKKEIQNKKVSNSAESRLDRILKQLYTDCNDNEIPIGKRRSSISATSAISEQINILHGKDDNRGVSSKKAKTIQRRKSLNEKNVRLREESSEVHGTKIRKEPPQKRRASICASDAISKQLKGIPLGRFQSQHQDDKILNVRVSKTKKIRSDSNASMEIELSDKCDESIDKLDKCNYSFNLHHTNEMLKDLKPAYVRLAKLSPQYIQSIQKESTLDDSKNNSIHSKDIAEISKSYFNSNKPKNRDPICKNNINSNMTEKNTKVCVLCPSKPNNLTNHYVGRHKTESYVSRLPLKILQELQINMPYATCVTVNNITQFSLKCVFCDKIITDEVLKLYDHFSIHTGEYAYKCSRCGLQKPTETDMRAHKSKSKKCSNKKINTLYSYNRSQMIIELFWCKLCNFVQLNYANVSRHIMEQHKKNLNSCDIECIFLVALDEPVVTNEPINDEDNINETATSINEYTGYECGPDIKPFTSVGFDSNENTLESYFDIDNVKCENGMDIDIDLHPDINDYNNCVVGDNGYKLIPADTSYFGLYKCMGSECFYSTNIDSEFTEHIKDHKDSNCPEIDILYCAYCINGFYTKYPSAEDLVMHINEFHGNSTFHCKYCSYRSCDSGNVLLHLESNHSQMEALIIQCGNKKVRDNHKSYLLEQLVMNVGELSCTYCPLSFYAVSSIFTHIESAHGVSAETCANDFKAFSCVYCFENFSEFVDIEKHLANEHPNQEPYICKRELRKPVQIESVCDLVCRPITKSVPKEKIILWDDHNLNISHEESAISHEDSTESLLFQLTQTTGVLPDHLYRCPNTNCRGIFSTYELWFQHIGRRHGNTAVNCPYSQYCKIFGLIELAQFKEHFKDHCIHQFVCFQCGLTFRYEYDVYDHTARKHNNAAEELCFQIFTMNSRLRYYILMPKKDFNTNAETFAMNLQILIKNRLAELAYAKNLQLNSYWSVPLSAEWLNGIPKYASVSERLKCKIHYCTFVGNSVEVFKHIKLNHSIDVGPDFGYTCNICKDFTAKVDAAAIATIEEHIKKHQENLYICCLCSYNHYNQKKMSNHCFSVHLYEDVPVINLVRSSNMMKMSLSIVFRLGQLTFSTIQTCFCCDLKTNDNTPDSYANHLSIDHKLTLKYVCEYCNDILDSFPNSKQHFEQKHPQFVYRIKAIINSFYGQDLIIKSLAPLVFYLASNSLDYKSFIENIKKEN